LKVDLGWQTLPAEAVTSIVDGLKKLYNEKLKPLEVAYRFNDFVSPTLVLFFAYLEVLVQILVKFVGIVRCGLGG